MEQKKITSEDIKNFLEGRDPMEHITSIEVSYKSNYVSIVTFNDERDKKEVKRDEFRPFLWAKQGVLDRMFGGDKKRTGREMRSSGIWVKALTVQVDENKPVSERLLNGYKYLVYATRPMSYGDFLEFFQRAGQPVYSKNSDGNREYMTVTPAEQYMIQTGKRLFKGYETYNEVKRLLFDIETQGLDPETKPIDQIGIRTNKGYEKILTVVGTGEDRLLSEKQVIEEFVEILAEQEAAIVAGHNSESFDFPYIMKRYEILGGDWEELTKKWFGSAIYKDKKASVLKLGGEMEYYYPTRLWGTTILDSLHAVRRAMATNSSIKSAGLKYITKYLELNKPNRVYVKGDKIGKIWADTNENYAFNDANGDWYRITSKKPLKDGYEKKTGRYIVERYLLDDLWEGDFVENNMNGTNFMICKILPTNFQRAATMGTAAIWKLIMLGWSYENNLAVPSTSEKMSFTGGLSRLLNVGFSANVAKLDYNSLYPATILSFDIKTPIDIMDAMSAMLEYVLTQREHHKGLKKKADKERERLKKEIEVETDENRKAQLREELKIQESIYAVEDARQNQLKTLANSYFGSAGSPNIFPWADLLAAEKTTCTGRQLLRLMIYHFKNLGYEPIVGDSFIGETEFLVKYNNTNEIKSVPVKELIDETKIEIDALGREYDMSKKNYKVLCRSGWLEPTYLYRHKTNKDIYHIEKDGCVFDVTEDHSLFNDERNKIKPSEITRETKFEYYKNSSPSHENKPLIIKKYKTNDYVYDISLDGTVVNSLGFNVLSQTDGFNVKLPETFRYTEENPYIGVGLSREVVKGKKYVGLDADIAEFNDLYMRIKEGLSVDEVIPSSINFSRKNYADLLDNGKTKKVGNSIKSRKMSKFIENLIDPSVDLLLNNKGNEFIEQYYNYIEKIYNYQISLEEIASKGKIKQTIEDYKKDCNTLTKSGNKKSRQAWYELCIKHNIVPNVGDTIYYVNTGKKKSESDVKRITHYYVRDEETNELVDVVKNNKFRRNLMKKIYNDENIYDKFDTFESEAKVKLTPALEFRLLKKKGYVVKEEDEIIFNCQLIPSELIGEDDDDDVKNEDDEETTTSTTEAEKIEYNVERYIDAINKRITPLLVCFHPDIRDKILITKPGDRKSFTDEQTKLCSGMPNKETDQDTYEAIMTPERKEIEFWLKIDEIPPFVKECGIDWDKLVEEYKETIEKEKSDYFKIKNNKYLEIINNLTIDEVVAFEDDGELPKRLSDFMTLNPKNMCLYFKDIPDMTPTTGGYIFDDLAIKDENEDFE
jgi:DNA polymerase elongation subunit (family B)